MRKTYTLVRHPFPRRWMLVSLIPLLSMALPACRRQEPPSPFPLSQPAFKSFAARGVIQSVAPDGLHAVIAHGPIHGYMEAMTMEFVVHDRQLLHDLVPGDEVTFRVNIDETNGWLDQVSKVGHTTVISPLKSTSASPELADGAEVPDCALLDQFGSAIHLKNFVGTPLAITFIFTRCPFPEYCPRLSARFSEAQQLLSAAKSDRAARFLSISFDPDFDTPAQLRAYAASLHADPSRWTFATAKVDEIAKFGSLFGFVFGRGKDGIDHNLRTVVLDSQGRLQRVFAGTSWTAQELVDELTRARPARD